MNSVKEQIKKPYWNSKLIPEDVSPGIRVLLITVLTICIIDILCDIFNIHPFMDLKYYWVNMTTTTSLCSGIIALALIFNLSGKQKMLRNFIPKMAGIFIIIISILAISINIRIMISGVKSDLADIPLFYFFIGEHQQMPWVYNLLFLDLGCILILMTSDAQRARNIAHIILIPAAMLSYFIPVSYLLGIYPLNDFKEISVALSTGIVLCLICYTLYYIRPDTWLMKVFTSKEAGGIMARKLMPALIILPIIIGWLKLSGERSELFKSEVGVVLGLIIYTTCFVLLVWMSARSVNKTSEKLNNEIEERKKADILLLENKARLERSQEIAHLGSWELDIVKNELLWSDEVYRIFGLTPGESGATYEAFLESVHPDDRDAVDNAFSSSVKENKNTYEIEHRIIRRGTGEIRFVCEKCQHFRDETGRIVRSIGMVHDITERKITENELKESKEKLNIALEGGNIGVWEWDLVTDEIILDKRMERMFELEAGSFGGTYRDFENLLNEDDILHFRNTISEALNKAAPFETIIRVKKENPETKYLNAKSIVQKDNSGALIKMTGVCFDISGLKKDTEQVLFDLNEELLRSNKELQQFAYIASHDLQEPLRMVSSFTQLLKMKYKDKLDSDAHEYIKFAVDGAKRMKTQIDDLLMLSRIQTRGKEFSEVDMQLVLERVVKILNPWIQEKKAVITGNLQVSIVGDEVQMVQLLQNLIGNSLKYSKKSPRIDISFKEEERSFLFRIKDNGIGMEPQYLERIFQIFQRLHSKDEYEGTGIGLAICKRIVERHKGKIWADSESGKGSSFYFTIPKKYKLENLLINQV